MIAHTRFIARFIAHSVAFSAAVFITLLAQRVPNRKLYRKPSLAMLDATLQACSNTR